MKRYEAIAKALGAMKRCEQAGNTEWQGKHEAAILEHCESLPSGSGFDNGSKLDFEASTSDKLVFVTAYHHMDENGCYDGWTDHRVTITPSFELGCHMVISGRDKNEIKEYISDVFHAALSQDVDQWAGYPKPEAVQAVS